MVRFIMSYNKNTFFINDPVVFTKKGISSIANAYGLNNKEILEGHLWVYEILAHVQQLTGEACLLKGGGCAQLYLPVEYQRCTVDLDIATSLEDEDLKMVLKSIAQKFNKSKFYIDYKKYIPESVKLTGQIIPMATYFLYIPFVFKQKKKKRVPILKIDFLFKDTSMLKKTYISQSETFGLKLNYSPITISLEEIICDKLLTLALTTVGLDPYKIVSVYKNIYDLYYLANSYNNISTFTAIKDQFPLNLLLEFETKGLTPINIKVIFEDILTALYKIATGDLQEDPRNMPKKIQRFQGENLQQSINDILDVDYWSIMCMYLYIWTYALESYMLRQDSSPLKIINSIIEEDERLWNLPMEVRNKYIEDLKGKIRTLEPSLNLSSTGNLLRLLYIYHIFLNFR